MGTNEMINDPDGLLKNKIIIILDYLKKYKKINMKIN